MAMQEEIMKERLSALLDEELGQHESLDFLKQMEHDAAGRRLWHRYAVVKEAIRSTSSQVLLPDAGFADRVREALKDEPVILAPRVSRRQTRERAATFALAASLAVLALIAGRSLNEYSPIKGAEMLARVEPAVNVPMDAELRDYLAIHDETTYLSGAQGMLPSIRLASHTGSR